MADYTNLATAQAALAQPSTSAAELAEIASYHRELWGAIANHPAVYDGLVNWISTQEAEFANQVKTTDAKTVDEQPLPVNSIVALADAEAEPATNVWATRPNPFAGIGGSYQAPEPPALPVNPVQAAAQAFVKPYPAPMAVQPQHGHGGPVVEVPAINSQSEPNYGLGAFETTVYNPMGDSSHARRKPKGAGIAVGAIVTLTLGISAVIVGSNVGGSHSPDLPVTVPVHAPVIQAPLTSLNGKVTDLNGSLGSRTGEIIDGIDRLRANTGMNFYVVYVDSMGSVDPCNWNTQVWNNANLGGGKDLLLTISTSSQHACLTTDGNLYQLTDGEREVIMANNMFGPSGAVNFADYTVKIINALYYNYMH